MQPKEVPSWLKIKPRITLMKAAKDTLIHARTTLNVKALTDTWDVTLVSMYRDRLTGGAS